MAASESAPGLWDDPIDDRDWNDLSDWAGQVFSIPLPDSEPIICIPVTVREVGIMDVEVGLVARYWSRVFWGGSEDLMQRKNEEEYVMIEVRTEGYRDNQIRIQH